MHEEDERLGLAQRLAADLVAVKWPQAEEIRAEARRRTRRTAVAASLSVLLLVSSAWVVAGRPGLGGGVATPVVAGAERGGSPVASPAAEAGSEPGLFSVPAPPTVAPAPMATAVDPIGPGDPDWIPPEALLQPEDVDPVLVADRAEVAQDTPLGDWAFNLAPWCPAYKSVETYGGLVRYRRQQTLQTPQRVVGMPETGTAVVHQTVMRLPGEAAKQVFADARTVSRVCESYTSTGEVQTRSGKPETMESSHAWSLLDQDFAGDESMLLEHHVKLTRPVGAGDIGSTLVVVVRVGDLVATVEGTGLSYERLRYGGTVNGYATHDALKLGQRAASWLCTASSPPC